MYTLTENQLKAAENFIKSIPSSTVKGNYERWLEKVNYDGNRVTTQNMGEFVSLAGGLEADLQTFPQEFANNVKNNIEFGEKIAPAEVSKEDIKVQKEKNIAITAKVKEEKVVVKPTAKVPVEKAVVAKKAIVATKSAKK